MTSSIDGFCGPVGSVKEDLTLIKELKKAKADVWIDKTSVAIGKKINTSATCVNAVVCSCFAGAAENEKDPAKRKAHMEGVHFMFDECNKSNENNIAKSTKGMASSTKKIAHFVIDKSTKK